MFAALPMSALGWITAVVDRQFDVGYGSGTAAGAQSGSVRSHAQSRRRDQHLRQAAVSRYRSFDSRKMLAT